jgi:LysM repeat protein
MAPGYNPVMIGSKTGRIFLILVMGLFLFSIVACESELESPTPSINPTLELTPYWTLNPSPTGNLSTPVLILATATALPTSTPITYTILKGDTMLGVALKYGITLEVLQKANPDIDPRILSLGTSLIIPLGDELPALLPTPTPLAVQLDHIKCYPTGDGGRWCVVPVRNTRNRSIENLSAQVVLYNQAGSVVAEGIVSAPLNILREGEEVALTIYFPGPFDYDLFPRVNLLTSFPVSQESVRYLKVAVEVENIEISNQGQHAQLSGTLSLAKKGLPANRIWLVGVAYDAGGEIVGQRKWEAANNLEPGKSMPFEMTVFSIGPSIERIEVLAEARP